MKTLKFLIATVLYYSGILNLFLLVKEKRAGSRKPLILLYHRVIADDDPEMTHSIRGMTTTPEIFKAELNFLKKKFSVISMNNLLKHLEEGTAIPRRSVAITFDDGWRDNYLNAFPILKNHEIPATIFITVNLTGTGDKVWFNKAIMIYKAQKMEPAKIMNIVRSICKDPIPPEELPENIVGFVDMLKPYNNKLIKEVIDQLFEASFPAQEKNEFPRNILNWDEIKEMSAAGIEFGSHGMTHGILPLLSKDDIQWELNESKKQMETNLGITIDTFSYPNGDYNSDIIDMVKAAGYRCALVTETGDKHAYKNLFTIPRVSVHSGASKGPGENFSKSLFMLKISGFQNILRGK